MRNKEKWGLITLIIIVATALPAAFPGGGVLAFADNVSENSGSYTVSSDSLSDNEAPHIDLSVEGGVVAIHATDSGTGVALIQADNAAVGIRKTLYQSENMYETGSSETAEAVLKITANGRYRIYAYDGKGNVTAENVEITDIVKPDIERYRSEAVDNMNSHFEKRDHPYDGSDKEPVYDEPARFGGDPSGNSYGGFKSEGGYIWRSASGSSAFADPESYSDWSMLKKKEEKAPERVWSEGALAGYVSLVPDDEEGGDMMREVYVLGTRKPSIFSEETSRIGDMIIEGGVPSQTGVEATGEGKGVGQATVLAVLLFVMLVAGGILIVIRIRRSGACAAGRHM
jgi:hypothetical protein